MNSLFYCIPLFLIVKCWSRWWSSILAAHPGYPETIKIYIAGPTLCESDLIVPGLWPGSQSFKSSLGNSNALPRLRTTALNWFHCLLMGLDISLNNTALGRYTFSESVDNKFPIFHCRRKPTKDIPVSQCGWWVCAVGLGEESGLPKVCVITGLLTPLNLHYHM